MAEQTGNIGFIGAGNMGEAFAAAFIKTGIYSPAMIHVSDINKKRLDFLNESYGISTTSDNYQLFKKCDVVILAVKPQQIGQVLRQIAAHKDYSIYTRKLVISLAAGIRLQKIEDLLYASLKENIRENLPVIRVMPNTPALVLKGMSGMSCNRYVNSKDKKTAGMILESMGKLVEFNEEKLDAVTAVSGSGPAYVFYLAESMIEGGINAGLSADDASFLTINTIKGAVKMMEELKDGPVRLRQKVTSPGGTTEAAFKVMEKNRVKQNIIKAIEAAAKRSKELSR